MHLNGSGGLVASNVASNEWNLERIQIPSNSIDPSFDSATIRIVRHAIGKDFRTQIRHHQANVSDARYLNCSIYLI